MKFIFSTTFSILFVLILVNQIQAQPPGLPSPPTQAPIDGGMSIILLGSGVALGVKKLRKK